MGASVTATEPEPAGSAPGGEAVAAADGLERIARRRGPLAALRFAAAHRMLTPKYALLAAALRACSD